MAAHILALFFFIYEKETKKKNPKKMGRKIQSKRKKKLKLQTIWATKEHLKNACAPGVRERERRGKKRRNNENCLKISRQLSTDRLSDFAKKKKK